jgi:hypothetical protein
VTEEETPIFERGDVVYGDDPFKSDKDARPWQHPTIVETGVSNA